jgi:hypothetical protein
MLWNLTAAAERQAQSELVKRQTRKVKKEEK